METQQTLPQQSENDLIAGGDTASTMPRESEGPCSTATW